MDFKDLAQMRRSHRKFTEEAVSKDDIKLILRSALMSPTSKGQRNWQFVVVEDKEKISALATAKDLGGQSVDAGHVGADGGDLPRLVFFKTHEGFRVIVSLCHHIGYDSVYLGGDNIAGIRDSDAAGDVIEKHGCSREKDTKTDEEHQQRKPRPHPPYGCGRTDGVSKALLRSIRSAVHGITPIHPVYADSLS